MKITLVSPFSDVSGTGIRTISACLKQNGHEVRLIFLPKDFRIRYDRQTLDQAVALAKGSDLIGITLMTNFFQNTIQLTRKFREETGIPVLWGGIHPTVRPEECLDHTEMICLGEGEETVVELAEKMEKGQDYRHIPGMWFKDRKKIIRNSMRPLIQDLNSLPFQDYGFENNYILSGGRIQEMTGPILNMHLAGDYMAFPTRGCPFGCAYCCNNTINNLYPGQKPLRKRSVKHIIGELTGAKEKLPFIRHVTFDDDAFFAYGEAEIEEFCREYKRKIGLPLDIGGATPTTLTRGKLSLLVNAGLTGIRMGIQTASERTKKLYKRRHSNELVEKSVNIINEFKDKIKDIRYDIIINNPWETREDLVSTLMFLARFPTPYRLNNFNLTFFPETELYKKARKDGLITDDIKEVYSKSYSKHEQTYLNDLFHLLSNYSNKGIRITPGMISLLTDKESLKSRLLYAALKAGSHLWKILDTLRIILVSLQKWDRTRFDRWYEYKFFINR